ncbi:MAG: GntR family transcriptional regulator [Gammaproteobacteria bacterium]|nr:MAG: GntR family transcriptional regulator [Gammaproteobacteria bacterium]
MAAAQINLRPVDTSVGLKDKVYLALKSAITAMDIYSGNQAPKLDERRLAEDLGVSRTPIREALSRLAQEGLVEMIPRRGTFVARKSKQEILEIISVWAALESMAARLATEVATDEEIGQLRRLFVTFEGPNRPQARIDEYSDTNIQFHQRIIALSKSELLKKMADSLFVHMRAIRAQTITERDRADRSIIDHLHIIEAIEARNTELAERLVREHSFGLAEHINNYVDYLD